jgi:hypothetical protein
MGHEELQAMLEKLGSVGVLMPSLTLAAGLILLTLGSKLARPMCTLSGLVLGGIGGLMIGEALADKGGIVLALIVGLAIAGALLSALLFRIWMAISGALIFGVTAASVVLLVQVPPEDTGPSEETGEYAEPADTEEADGLTIEIPIDELTEQVREGFAEAMADGEEGEPAQLTIDEETAKKVGWAIVDALRGMSAYYWNQLGLWWGEAGSGARGGMLLVGLVAAVIGLLLGLVGPYKAASVQSAVAGAVLILFSAFSLVAQLRPEQMEWLPATPRGVLVGLGLITAVGLGLQWTVFKRNTDK